MPSVDFLQLRLYSDHMAQRPENLVIRHLRAIRRDIAELTQNTCAVSARLDQLAAQGISFLHRLARIGNRWTPLESDPRFVARVEKARASLRAGRGVKLEDL